MQRVGGDQIQTKIIDTRNMFIKSSFLFLFLLLCSLLQSIRTAPEIQLHHLTIEPTDSNNLLKELIHYSSDTFSRTAASSLATIIRNQEKDHLQLMIQLNNVSHVAQVEKILGKELKHVIPPQTYIIHENINELSNKLKAVDNIEHYVRWIGYVKPEYKTKLNFKSLSQMSRNQTLSSVSLSHPDSISLYVILLTEKMEHSQLFASMVENHLSRRFNIRKSYADKGSSIEIEKYVVSQLVSPRKMLVKTTPHVADQVLEFLKSQEQVLWIERKLPIGLFNDAANEILQSDGITLTPQGIKKPIWKRGITGLGEVVGVGDTGIDYDMCFFRDPNVSVSFNSVNPAHRKIVGYETVTIFYPETGKTYTSDEQDIPSGHGTHVAGSIAGSMFSDAPNFDKLSRFAGVAKDAKLYFTDIYNPMYNTLLIPDDLYTSYFPKPYTEGKARIHSNSWGCSFNAFQCQYDCVCQWAYDTQYGKRGQRVSNDWCIDNLGNDCCKICNVYDSRASEVDHFVYENDDMLIIYPSGNIGFYSSSGTLSSPGTAKNVLTVGASQTTNTNFLESVDYEDLSEIFNILEKRGIHNTAECCAAVGRTPEETQFIKGLCCPPYIKQYYQTYVNYFDWQNMAYFSSRGPSSDGRIKPDIVGPGYSVVSMHSDGNPRSNQCGLMRPNGDNPAALMTLKGTSMSAPLVAGAAALVRQYVREKNLSTNPSGALVKALLIHSGQQLTGMVNMDGRGLLKNIPKAPNFISGFGLISLDKVLQFPDSPFDLFTYDRVSISQNDRNAYCFKNLQSSEFKATLTWYDPPASPSAQTLLVNNLDLDVFYYKNGTKQSTRVPGNGNSEGDSLNTVEQSTATHIPKDDIVVVTVTAERISKGSTQKYSLVITGNVESLDSCWVPPRPVSSKRITYIIIGVSAAVAVLIIVSSIAAIAFLKYMDYRKKQINLFGRRLGSGHVTLQDEDEEPSISEPPPASVNNEENTNTPYYERSSSSNQENSA
jgi:subtilisin family serine protease